MKKTPATTIHYLPYEILLKIFTLLNMADLILGASRVCTLWHSVCHEPSLWRNMNLNKIDPEHFGAPVTRRWMCEVQSSRVLMQILKSGLALSGGNVTTLVFHYFMLVEGDCLVHTAKRTPNLRRLVLPSWRQVDWVGFKEAIKHWKNLESLTLPNDDLPHDVIRDVGTSYRNFVELKLMMCNLNFRLVNSLISYMPQLKVLSLWNAIIYRKSVAHLLKGMVRLEVLKLSHSRLVGDYSYDEAGNLLDFGDEDTEINPIVSNRNKFVKYCEKFITGDRCKYQFVDDEEFQQWYEDEGKSSREV